MKTFHKMVTPPPPYCFYEILILIFSRFFRGITFLNKRYEIRVTPPQCLRMGVQEVIFVFDHLPCFSEYKKVQLG